ncbi:hypothetical protein SMSP1_01523 [Sedimentisphaera salicampi]|nr:hypothetical protein SMSP1_01523 [Sedimentisphaera salicampi]
MDNLRADAFDPRLAVYAVCNHLDLMAGEAESLIPHTLNRHSHQGYCLLFAGTQELIHLTLGRVWIELMRISYKLIGLLAPRRGNHNYLVPLLVLGDSPLRCVPDLFRICN